MSTPMFETKILNEVKIVSISLNIISKEKGILNLNESLIPSFYFLSKLQNKQTFPSYFHHFSIVIVHNC